MPYEFTLTTLMPASAQEVYEAWLDSLSHSEMTGSPARMSGEVDAEISAWDGYISGRNLQLVPHQRIVQSWRTTKFGDAHEDSIVTVSLEDTDDGALLTLVHSNVPDEQTSYQESGWERSYFVPMKTYFAERGHAADASVGEAAAMAEMMKAPASRARRAKRAPAKAKARASNPSAKARGKAATAKPRAVKAKAAAARPKSVGPKSTKAKSTKARGTKAKSARAKSATATGAKAKRAQPKTAKARAAQAKPVKARAVKARATKATPPKAKAPVARPKSLARGAKAPAGAKPKSARAAPKAKAKPTGRAKPRGPAKGTARGRSR